MIGLFDRDVFYKLIVCDLWEPALEVLGVTEPYRLSATSNERSNRRALSVRLDGEDLEVATARLENALPLVPTLSDGLTTGIAQTVEYQSLSETDGIDDGELMLASVLLRSPDSRVLVTGDKRFVNAFKDHHPEYWAAVGESLITFEQCVLKILAVHGFEYVRSRAFNSRKCDHSLRLSFGDGRSADDFLAGLLSFAR